MQPFISWSYIATISHLHFHSEVAGFMLTQKVELNKKFCSAYEFLVFILNKKFIIQKLFQV